MFPSGPQSWRGTGSRHPKVLGQQVWGLPVAVGLAHLPGKAVLVSVRAWETQPPSFWGRKQVQREGCWGWEGEPRENAGLTR